MFDGSRGARIMGKLQSTLGTKQLSQMVTQLHFGLYCILQSASLLVHGSKVAPLSQQQLPWEQM